MLLSPPLGESNPSSSIQSRDSFIFPAVGRSSDGSAPEPPLSVSPPRSSQSSVNTIDLSESTSSVGSFDVGTITPKGKVVAPPSPSGLSLLLARRQGYPSSDETHQEGHSSEAPPSDSTQTPTIEHYRTLPPPVEQPLNVESDAPSQPTVSQSPQSTRWEHDPPVLQDEGLNDITETVPLLGTREADRIWYTLNGHAHPESGPKSRRGILKTIASHIHRAVKAQNIEHSLLTAVNSLPAVLLGCLLNILDGVSCEYCYK